MLIAEKNYRINVLILLMPSEEDVTIETLETLLLGTEEGVTISVLLNGGESQRLREMFSPVDCIRYYESPENLGVAGGRNFLLKTPECKESDIVMILDNDVVVPSDYIRNLASFLIAQDDAGIVGAAAANIRYVPYEFLRYYGEHGRFGNRIFKFTSNEIKRHILNDLSPERLFHIGVHPDFKYAYFSVRPRYQEIRASFLRLFGVVKNYTPYLTWNTRYLQLISNGEDKYNVSNVAGCSQAFRRELVDEIGCLNDMFNPYGFEDVDFCIRAIKAGYRNYIDTNTWLCHGTDTRHKGRDSIKAYEPIFKGLTVLASLIFAGSLRYKYTILKLITFDFPADLVAHRVEAFKLFKTKLTGFKKGMKIVEENAKKI